MDLARDEHLDVGDAHPRDERPRCERCGDRTVPLTAYVSHEEQGVRRKVFTVVLCRGCDLNDPGSFCPPCPGAPSP